MPERSKTGRKPRGVRSPLTARVPVEHKKLYEELAAQMGVPLVDYVALVMARAHELADPDYIHLPAGTDVPAHMELPLSA